MYYLGEFVQIARALSTTVAVGSLQFKQVADVLRRFDGAEDFEVSTRQLDRDIEGRDLPHQKNAADRTHLANDPRDRLIGHQRL